LAVCTYNASVAPPGAAFTGTSMTTSHSPFKSKGGLARLFKALRYSAQGLAAAFRHEAAFRQELLLAVVMTPMAFWLGRNPIETMMLLGTLVLLLIVELLNSAMEALADAITLEPHPLVGRAKDLGSAAVMLTILLGAAVWVCVALRL